MSGATLTFYRAGTTTKISIYQNSQATTPHTNPVVADASGNFAAIFLATADAYKFILKTSAGVTVQTVDRIPVGGDLDTETLEQVIDELENAVGEFTGRALIYDLADTVGYDAGGRDLVNVGGATFSDTVIPANKMGAIQFGSGSAFGLISNLAIRVTTDEHVFENWGTWNVGVGTGICGFDDKPVVNITTSIGHVASYQARPRITGTGNITDYTYGFHSQLILENFSGSIAKRHDFHSLAPSITGGDPLLSEHVGFYAENSSAWAVNSWGVYSAHPNNRFNAVQISNDLALDGLLTTSSANVRLGKPAVLPSYAYADLPGVLEGGVAYCSNGCKAYEGAGSGAGTGVPVYYADGAWRRFSDDLTVVI